MGGGLTHRAGITMIIMSMAIALLLLASGCGSEGPTVRTTVLEPPPLTQDLLMEMAKGYDGTTEVRSATITSEGNNKVIDVGIDRAANCGNGSVAGVMSAYSSGLMSNLFSYPEVSKVTITMYGTQQGVKSDSVAVRVVVDRATAEFMEWGMFGPMTMPDMVSQYYIDPVIDQSTFSGQHGY